MEILQVWSKLYLNSQINFGKFNKTSFENTSAYGYTSGYPIMNPIKKYDFIAKSNHLCLFQSKYAVNYDNANQYKENKNRLKHLFLHINTKTCVYKRDEIGNENDITHVTGYRDLAKRIILKQKITEGLEDHFINATCFSKETAIEKKEIRFCLKTGLVKTTHQKKLARNFFNPMSKQRV